MFMTVGIIISIFGFIAGIVTGSATHNFLFCLWVWIGTFLYALIYFGFAAILQAIAELKAQLPMLVAEAMKSPKVEIEVDEKSYKTAKQKIADLFNMIFTR